MYIILTFVFASVSLLYEFSLSQMLTSLTGSTFRNYCMIIGLYTASLGFGALMFDLYIKNKKPSLLITTELVLSLTAFLAPFFICILYSSSFDFLPHTLRFVFALVPVIAIGLLSGIELPALIHLSKQPLNKIMFADFIGMFFSSIIFYNYLLLKFSIFQILFSLALANSLCCFIIFYHEKIRPKKNAKAYAFTIANSLVITIGLACHWNVLLWAQRLFIK